MSTPRVYWVGGQVVVDWTLRDGTAQPVTDATVTGEVTRPDGTTVTASVTPLQGGVYRATYVATEPGAHAYQLTAAGTATDTTQGTFVVARDRVGAAPINLDPTTNVGLIRLLITDVDETSPLFEDAQLTALLTAEGGHVKRAAAAALETIARSEVLIAKVISTQDLSTNGPAVAAELRASAKALRDQADVDLQDGNQAPAQALLPVWSFPPPVEWGDAFL